MECNKGEALRAMEIAERKFKERDYAGAKKFILKAQNLYPDVEGLSQMLVTFDVFASAEKRTITGEIDWYSVLGLKPRSDDETVRKQYRKLALMLHPDKNKSLGADGAFKLVSEAWSFLSNKAHKLAYDEKLNAMGSEQKVSGHSRVQSTQSSANGFYHGSTMVNSDSRANYTRMGQTSGPPPSFQKPDTFWTICNRCKTQYEYLRMYLNHTLLCPNCHEAFSAVEKAPPPNLVKSTSSSARQKHQGSRNRAVNNSYSVGAGQSSNGSDLHWNHFSRMAGASTTGVQQMNQRFKRELEEEKMAAGFRTGNSSGIDHLFKRRRTEETTYGASTVNGKSGLGSGYEERRGNFETERAYGFSGNLSKSNTKRELSPLELRNLLMNKSRLSITEKLQEWSLGQAKKQKEKKTAKSDAINGDFKLGSSGVTNEQNKNQKSGPGVKNVPMSITVPDSDFHNFDLDRTESSFGEDQVWAAYDDDDGMPRYYARIQKVISKKPFKMKISWLNSRSGREFSSIDWVGSGFLKTCGDFRAGRYQNSQRLNSFSHKVKWQKRLHGLIRIIPSKGEVWALYRNWSADWNQNTPNEIIHQYDMVEVVDDFDEEQGVSVAPLTKVSGFKTVFQRNLDGVEAKRIPKEEMFRFSHQVPYHVLTGEEARDAPKGCWELDPAATPLELLEVMPEAKEAEKVETEKPEEVTVDCTGGDNDQTTEQVSNPVL